MPGRPALFVVPLDVRGDWFRFHHLFAEVLRDDLARTEPDLVPRLHTRAAQWLAAHDQPVAAVRHALAGDDPELTASLVARHAPVLTRIGQVETALSWFRTLGDDVCRADPRLAAARALTGAHTGRPHEIVSWAAAAEQALDAPAPGRPQLTPGETTAARIEIAMLRWAAAIFAGEFAASRRHVNEALRLFPAGAGAPSGFMLLALGVSCFRTGEADASWATLVEAESVAEDRGEPLAVVAARGLRALQAAVGGRLEEAARIAASAATVAEQNGLIEHFNTATLRAAQGWGRAAHREAMESGRALPTGARAGPAQGHARGGRGAARRAGACRGAPRTAHRGRRAPRGGPAGPRELPGPRVHVGRPREAEPDPPATVWRSAGGRPRSWRCWPRRSPPSRSASV